MGWRYYRGNKLFFNKSGGFLKLFSTRTNNIVCPIYDELSQEYGKKYIE